jgi:hypothetical protein
MSTELALLPSPLLGPAVWTPVAECLRRRGWPVRIAAPAGEVGTPDDVLEGFLRALPAGRALVLVPHSNAGLYVPSLLRERDVAATVFVDAALPASEGATPLGPPALYRLLQELADRDGRLPPWTRWWNEADVAALFPGKDVRRRVEAEQHRLPLAYFGSSVDVPAGWVDRPNAYIAFGDTYGGEHAEAEKHGWPVRTIPGRHLHMLVDPEQVAATVGDLLAVLAVRP